MSIPTVALLLLSPLTQHVALPPEQVELAKPQAPPQQQALPEQQAPAELFEVVKIVDGDTLHVLRHGEKVKLRLMSVDTEEKPSGRPDVNPTKPETLFGLETTAWTEALLESRARVDGTLQVGLAFPDGREELDVYGRLLCHVLLPDGTDYNLLLVREGMSPYFNKYGNSTICDADFRAAQALAQREQLGIWNPATNRAHDPDAPSVLRPYATLLPWWEARAEAVEAFRSKRAENPIQHVAADDPEGLTLSAYACAAGASVEVFGTIFRVFDEDDGTQTLLFRGGDRERNFRAKIPAEMIAACSELALRERAEQEFIQNFVSVRGQLVHTPRGFHIDVHAADQIRVAAPEYSPPIAVEATHAGGVRMPSTGELQHDSASDPDRHEP